MSEANAEPISQWAIVEIVGRKVLAGRAAPDASWGAPMIRIDVPQTSAYPSFTAWYHTNVLYGITPVSEKVAHLTAQELKVNPVSVYVPNLITVEEHKEKMAQFQSRLDNLQKRLDPATQLAAAGTRPEGDDLDDDLDEDDEEV